MNPTLKIVLSDVSKTKLATAKGRGVPADFFLTPDEMLERWSARRLDASAPCGNSLFIHANPRKESVKQSFRLAPNSSTILFFSGVYDWTESDNAELGVSIDPKALHYEDCESEIALRGKRISLLGSRGYSREDFEHSASLVLSKSLDPLPLVTKLLKFDEGALAALEAEGADEANLKILMSPREELLCDLDLDAFALCRNRA